MAVSVKKANVNESEILARMAGVNNYQMPSVSTPVMMDREIPVEERNANEGEEIKDAQTGGNGKKDDKESETPVKEKNGREEEQVKDIRTSGNGKRNTYEEKYLARTIYGTHRGNVGISKNTLDIAERIIARIFDNRIATGAYIDNILREHFNRYKKDYELWLAEKPLEIF